MSYNRDTVATSAVLRCSGYLYSILQVPDVRKKNNHSLIWSVQLMLLYCQSNPHLEAGNSGINTTSSC